MGYGHLRKDWRRASFMNRHGWSAMILAFLAAGVVGPLIHTAQSIEEDSLAFPGERHLHNIRQLTFGGQNAEAYFSFDGKKLIFQSTRDGYPVDQIYMMNIDGSNVHRVSTGKGRCTCSYFLKGDRRILYASTHLADEKP